MRDLTVIFFQAQRPGIKPCILEQMDGSHFTFILHFHFSCDFYGFLLQQNKFCHVAL